MGGDGGARRQRILDLLTTLEAHGRVDTRTLGRAACKRWLITPRTAQNYIDALIEAGWAVMDYGFLRMTDLGMSALKGEQEPPLAQAELPPPRADSPQAPAAEAPPSPPSSNDGGEVSDNGGTGNATTDRASG